MINILLVSEYKYGFTALISALEKRDNVDIYFARSGRQAISMAREIAYDLVVVNESVGDMTGLSFIEKLVRINPMLNIAAVSSLSEDDFHEAGEGLGVLTRLPAEPGEKDLHELMGKLEAVMYPRTKMGA